MTIELFVCAPQSGAKLTRSACAKRHEAAGGGPRRARMAGWEPGLPASTCAGCPVGAAHVRGETPTHWPDGAPIELVTLTPPARPQRVADSVEVLPHLHREAFEAAVARAEAQQRTATPRRRRRSRGKGGVMPPPKLVRWGDREHSIRGWSRQPDVAALGIYPRLISYRLKSDWSIERTLTTPVRGRG